MFEVDELAYRSAALRWSPAGKFLFALSLLVASLMATTLLVPLVVLIIGVALLGYSVRFRFPKVIGLLVLEGVGIIILGGLVVAIVTPGEAVWSLDLGLFKLIFSDTGLATASLVTLRALAGIGIMLFFATSTPIPHFADMLVRLKVPKEFAEMMVMVYRYSFMLLDEAGRMHLAAQCRLGFRGRMNTMRTYAKMMVGMFIRSMETAERSNVGMQCRNYQSGVAMLRQPKGITYAWAGLSVLSFLLLYQLNELCVSSGILLG
ncbi:MAG TPA: cobalt ECF transporter T component CbiQ [Methanomassiliicoccales archaeon]|nr:cobalt ECF transporter T component CbiQ [Methanomassiliicoccales archaeon]